MAHWEQQEFCTRIQRVFPEYFKQKHVLDIGSLDVNGNNRSLFTDCTYLGLDVGDGPNVDVVSVGHLYQAPDATFDVIISTEVFEHDMFYEKTIENIIRMLKPGGAFIFTCASTGRAEHGTVKSDGSYAAPLLREISEEWSHYYKNLTETDIKHINGFDVAFPNGWFEYNPNNCDLYFFGVKGGITDTQKDILLNTPRSDNQFRITFNGVPKVETHQLGGTSILVQFFGIDLNGTEQLVYETSLTDGMWAAPSDNNFSHWAIYIDGNPVHIINV